MDSLPHLNAFISERLTAAAVEIFGAVEKTLIEYQREISRSKQEVDQLRSLVLWPEVRLHRSAAHQLSARCCRKELSPERCHEEDRASSVSTEDQVTLCVKEEHDQNTDQRGPSCIQRRDTRRQSHREPPSHLYRILNVEQTAEIKADPDADEFITSPSTRLAESHCGIDSESCGFQQETLKDPLEITDHAQDWSDEHHYPEQDWSPCLEHEDPDPSQIKVEKLTSSSPQKETEYDYNPPLRSERSVYDEPRCSSPRQEQTLSIQTFHTGKDKRRSAEGAGCQLSRLIRASQPFCSVSLDCDNYTEGVVNGEPVKVHMLAETSKRKRKILCNKEMERIAVEEDVNDLTRERRHTCPICAKRFKESSHLKEHVRIHTGEKPYQCAQCGVNFRQSGALTLHMRIHTGERPYQCADCGRRFNRKGDMETHRVTHTGERPHLCMVCGKSFRRKSNLNTHLKIHTEGKRDYAPPL